MLRYVVTVVAVPVTSLASAVATDVVAEGRNLKQFQVRVVAEVTCQLSLAQIHEPPNPGPNDAAV